MFYFIYMGFGFYFEETQSKIHSLFRYVKSFCHLSKTSKIRHHIFQSIGVHINI